MRRLALTSLLFFTACSPALQSDTATATALDCFREHGFSMLAAHRAGPAPGYPENALSSLQRLGALGVLYAEVDVRRSADGVLFLLHDDTLDRTTTGSGPAETRDWAELAALNLIDNSGQASTQTMPTLEAAGRVAVTSGVILNLDLKSVPPADIVDFIHAHDLRDHVSIIAYTVDQAAALHALDPGLLLSAPDEPDTLAAAGVNLDATYLWLGTGYVDSEADIRFAARGLETSAGLFRFEPAGPDLYTHARNAGVEILSIDHVDDAVAALGGAETLRQQIETCSAP